MEQKQSSGTKLYLKHKILCTMDTFYASLSSIERRQRISGTHQPRNLE